MKRTKEFLDSISALAEQLRRQAEADADGWDISPEKIAERRRHVANEHFGFAYFHRTYFPHYGRAEPSALHEYLHKRLPAIVRSPRGERDVIAAPRGEAKSTVVSLIFVLWCVVLKLKHYPIIVMDSSPQADEMLEGLKAELEANPRLRSDFPEACGQGRVWRVGCVITANDIKIEAFGAGKKILGRRHGPFRPDLAVMDDMENDENVVTPAQRDKMERFIKRSVLSLGPADDSMDAILVGTVRHFDSVLARFLKNPLWNKRVFKAIIQWPDRTDLWERFEELLLSGDSPEHGENQAMAFYEANREAMDAGAVVSWPAVRPLVKLMIKRAREGHESFDSEQQNDPSSGDEAIFANCIQFWINRLPDWVFYGSCDPSMGRAVAGRDPSAILVGGFNRNTGILDVVHAGIRKRTPDKIISDVIEAHREWGCLVWGFEAVVFAEFVRTELVKRSAQLDPPVPVPAIPLNPIADKDLRIESLQPHMANGLIRLHRSQTTLHDQLKHYPKADHKDGPDALQMLWMLCITGGVGAGVQVHDTTARGREYFDRAARQAQRMFARRR